MKYYIVAKKGSEIYLTFNRSNYDFRECSFLKAERFENIEYARLMLLECLCPKNCEKNIENYEILEVECQLTSKKEPSIDYSKPFKFSYSTHSYDISKEDVTRMLDFLYGIKNKDFDFTFKIQYPRSKTHIAKILVNFK